MLNTPLNGVSIVPIVFFFYFSFAFHLYGKTDENFPPNGTVQFSSAFHLNKKQNKIIILEN